MKEIDKVIKNLEEYRDREFVKEGITVFDANPLYRKMIITDALAMLKEHGWIPITERLPKDDTDILVYCTDGEESRIVAVNYANGVWFDCVFNTVMVVENITHWMPLPKPPKEGR